MIKALINFFKRNGPVHIHEWTMWSEPYQKIEDSFYSYQNRKCKTCNLVEEKLVKLKGLL